MGIGSTYRYTVKEAEGRVFKEGRDYYFYSLLLVPKRHLFDDCTIFCQLPGNDCFGCVNLIPNNAMASTLMHTSLFLVLLSPWHH